jgi:peptidoglycan/xylan/chitin deacetylase (PgdA/CDA1 family)
MKTGDYHGLFDYSPIVDRPPLKWPTGAPVAVWVVPNIEHYELEMIGRKADVRNTSHRDYGNRVGIWRMMDAMQAVGVRGTVALNSAVCRHYPRVLEEALKLGWELMGHGLTNSEANDKLEPDDERRMIEATVAEIQAFQARPPRGWLGPGLSETLATLDLLKGAGLEYTCDWVNDDQPYRMRNGLYSIPYTIELNDRPVFREPWTAPWHYDRMIRDSFDVLAREGAVHGRVMCIALHPFITGQPNKIGALRSALEYVAASGQAWLATGGEIIDAYKEHERANGLAPAAASAA